MKEKKKQKSLVGLGVFSAIAASLCCITPVLALVAGSTGMAASFSWLEPARPYLIGLTVLVLGFAWYQKLRTKADIDCDCEDDEKPSFLQTTGFLMIVTAFAAVTLAFPYYGHVFYPDNSKEVVYVQADEVSTLSVSVNGMTCTGCEEHIVHAVNELNGIIDVSASYEDGAAMIKYDGSQLAQQAILDAINATGYEAEVINKSNP